MIKSNNIKALTFSGAAIAGAVAVPMEAREADSCVQESQGRPNIVVIVADDLLTSELSCYGGKNIVTPNIDRLASEGVRFTGNYASEAMSVPTRASMYTGLYPMHHGAFRNHKPVYKGTKTVNDYMPALGYRVGRTGKTHTPPENLYKFDQIPGFVKNCTATEAPFSCDGIREWMTRSDDPFLLYVCSINTHAPWTWGDPSEFRAEDVILPENSVQSDEMREIFTRYLAEMRCLDNEVGAVVQTLEEIGKLDNTIVMFLGEQGAQFPGAKWTLWYPGCHSALIARYPPQIEAGRVCNALVQYEDLLPTFIDIAGGEPVESIDGISFSDALFGRSEEARRYVYGIHHTLPGAVPYPIRSIRDKRYALILNLMPYNTYYEHNLMNPAGTHTGVWEAWERAATNDVDAAFWKERFVKRPAVEFYDLEKDPWERNNLAGKKKYAKKIAEMRKELEIWMDSQGDLGAEIEKGKK